MERTTRYVHDDNVEDLQGYLEMSDDEQAYWIGKIATLGELRKRGGSVTIAELLAMGCTDHNVGQYIKSGNVRRDGDRLTLTT